MKHLVIGYKGEVGSAIYKILKEAYQVKGIDQNNEFYSAFDYLHICIPYSKDFINIVLNYQKKYLFPEGLTIIHSTVPVGTSNLLNAVHSPIRGVHPDLIKGIKTFVKYFGGKRANEAAKIFEDLGIKTFIIENASDCEVAKLWDTTQYGWMIILNKKIYQWCKETGVNFNFIYTEWNKSYNEGYTKLNKSEVVRPYLFYMPGKIGGHCIIPNCKIFNNEICEQILSENDKLV